MLEEMISGAGVLVETMTDGASDALVSGREVVVGAGTSEVDVEAKLITVEEEDLR